MDVQLLRHFETIVDPRVERTRFHSLIDIIAITICGVLCGADGWDDIHFYATHLESWYRTFLLLEYGIPSSDTIRRVISAMHPDAFHACFQSWVQSITTHLPGTVVAIDGKTLRGAYGPDDPKALLHSVNAWSDAQHLVLAEVVVAEKSHEITAIPEILKLLMLEGCIVTIDAAGCQKKITKTIIAQHAGYAITVKGNQEHVRRDIETTFMAYDARENDSTPIIPLVTAEYQHGRHETRTARLTYDLSRLTTRADWAGLTHIGMMTRERVLQGEKHTETRYYILSGVTTAEQFAAVVRSHWGIENCVHWSLDVTFHEDSSRIYDGYGAANISTVRKIALNILTQDKTKRLSLRKKRILCSMNPNYLEEVLRNAVF